MSENIGETIRSIHAAALRDNADPVLYVQDYLAEKNGRCSRTYAAAMIDRHVTQQRALDAETPLGQALDGRGDEVEL